jgi:signal transduction histidine kinase/ligand-binding sensor domain-containing protein
MALARLGAPVAWALAALVTAANAGAQPTEIRHFTIADGLAHNSVHSLFLDSMGYLWVSTAEGVSRFDGSSFVTYGIGQGLGHPIVNGVAEDARGQIWVADWSGGLKRLAGDRFVSEPVGVSDGRAAPGRVTTAADGSLWFLTEGDAYHGTVDRNGRMSFALKLDSSSPPVDSRVFRDRGGAIWLTVDAGLARVDAAGITKYDQPGDPTGVVALADRPGGGIFAASAQHLFEFTPAGNPGARGSWTRVAIDLPHDPPYLRSLASGDEGVVWIGTGVGLLRWEGGRITEVPVPGVRRPYVEALLVDPLGALWFGVRGAGLYSLARRSVKGWTVADGLPEMDIRRVLEDPAGLPLVTTASSGVASFDGISWRPMPSSAREPFAGATRLVRDTQGAWWLSAGVAGVPGIGAVHYLPPGPLDFGRARVVFRDASRPTWVEPSISADPRGGVWIGGPSALFHADNGAPDDLKRVTLPADFADPVARVVRDKAGNVWVSGYSHVARLSDGGPPRVWRDLLARAMFVDSRGWLWLGTRYAGAMLVRDPQAPDPSFESYSSHQGLSSGAVWAIAEDHSGRIYLGSGRGVHRLDAGTRQLRALSAPLDALVVSSMLTDRTGRIWVAAPTGLFEIDPNAEATVEPPPVYLSTIRVNGSPLAMEGRGATAVTSAVPGGRPHLQIEFRSVSLAASGDWRFQYRLEGAETDWRGPTRDRGVTYAGLSPGRYRFAVRLADGPPDREASFSFVVPAPAWQRSWFITLAVLALGGSGAAVQRWRRRQARALEHLRRQVALDLHDDVGSGLAEIAILSEVARENPDRAASVWAEVGDHARTLREAMTDIVWSIDPREDRLDSLVHRMRRVASTLLAANGVRLEFDSPPDVALRRVRMAPDRRRHLLLAFKEAVHNVARHAHATQARVAFSLDGASVRLSVQDDGVGFDREATTPGRGLESLTRRAGLIGGRLSVDSTQGSGTIITLTAPLKSGRAATLD